RVVREGAQPMLGQMFGNERTQPLAKRVCVLGIFVDERIRGTVHAHRRFFRSGHISVRVCNSGPVPTVAANGIEIYYERHGSGSPLLWFNGSGGTIARTRVLLDPYVKHFDVVAHDQRGLGQTSIPPGPYEMSDYAADAAALLDAFGWERCRIV